MIDRDKIAYLQELAISHFNDGNLAAAASAWKQVLEADPRNAEALKGIALAQGAGAPASDPFGDPSASGEEAYDADATMMFTADQAAPFGAGAPFGSGVADPFGAAPAPAAPAFDADRTMQFNPAAPPPVRPAATPSFDADRTMQFNPGAPPPVRPAPAAPSFDADRTMAFNPGMVPPPPPSGGGAFDADKTMLFGQPAPVAPPPAAPSGFDPERTMQFNPSAPPPVRPSAPSSGFDADRTMVYGSGDAPPAFPPPASMPPPAASPWGAPPPPTPAGGTDWLAGTGAAGGAASRDADSTALSPEPDFTSRPAPIPPPPSQKPGASGGRELEEFVMPTGGLQMPDSPGFKPKGGGFGSDVVPAAAGFSFELPSSTGGRGGSAFDLPDLPSVGLGAPPPMFNPPPPPPAVPALPRKSQTQFGDVEPGEAEALAVPTIGVGRDQEEKLPEPGTPEAREREDRLKREYEQQYGKSPVSGSALPRPAVQSQAPKSRLTLYFVLGLIGLMAAAWAVINYVIPKKDIKGAERVVRTVEPKLTAEAATEALMKKLGEAQAFTRQHKVDLAAAAMKDAAEIARKAGIDLPPEYITVGSEVEQERAYRAAFEKAQRAFCVEDYQTAMFAFTDLEKKRPADPEPGQYIKRIYYNKGIENLQAKTPWEAVWYFEQITLRDAKDAEALKLMNFASQFKPGADLGYRYTQQVDPLVDRTVGCR